MPYDPPSLIFHSSPRTDDDACTVRIVHEGMEINIPLSAARLTILLEDGQKYLGNYVRKHG